MYIFTLFFLFFFLLLFPSVFSSFSLSLALTNIANKVLLILWRLGYLVERLKKTLQLWTGKQILFAHFMIQSIPVVATRGRLYSLIKTDCIPVLLTCSCDILSSNLHPSLYFLQSWKSKTVQIPVHFDSSLPYALLFVWSFLLHPLRPNKLGWSSG